MHLKNINFRWDEFMKKILILLIICFLMFGCNNESKKIQKLMEENDYVIIDVRTKEEYDEQDMVDAINIPYDEIDENIELDKDKLVFVYCKSGNRSSIAYQSLIELGYNVYVLGAYSKIKLPKE